VKSWNDSNAVETFFNAVQNDTIVLAESDTVLGLFGRLSLVSKEKLDLIKQRNLKPYIVLIQSVSLISNFIDQDLDATMQKIMDTYWPGPLTIIFKAKSTLPGWLVGNQGTIALRIPHHQGLQAVLQRLDGLFTTSANISDQPMPDSYKNMNPKILEQVGFVCCQKDFMYDGPASTILDFSSGSIKVIRLGSIVIDSI
jgi:L-threonylcarbamoyladenylate synthase